MIASASECMGRPDQSARHCPKFSSTADTQRQLRLAPGTNYVEFYYASGSVKDVPGCWEVVTDASFDRNGRKPVEIVEGQTAKVELKVRWNETKVPKNKNILTLASGGTYTSKTKAKKADDSGRPAAVVEGKVVDAISGKPATRARVWAQRDNPTFPRKSRLPIRKGDIVCCSGRAHTASGRTARIAQLALS